MLNRFITKTVVAAGLAVMATMAAAQSAGEKEFMNSCAVCHGADATGNGPLAQVMNTGAPDLTLLSQNNDGEFPMLMVVHVIDGRTGVRSHGSDMPDWAGGMPVWGDRFTADAGEQYGTYGTELFVRGRVLALADYLESIQK